MQEESAAFVSIPACVDPRAKQEACAHFRAVSGLPLLPVVFPTASSVEQYQRVGGFPRWSIAVSFLIKGVSRQYLYSSSLPSSPPGWKPRPKAITPASLPWCEVRDEKTTQLQAPPRLSERGMGAAVASSREDGGE